MATLSELRTIWYQILREEEDCQAYPYVFMDALLNTAQLNICAGIVINPLTKEVAGKWQLPFLYKDQYYSNIGPSTLTTATTVGATELEIADTTNYSTTGVLYIWWQIITYTGKTATEFTGVSGIAFAYPAGTQVSQAFALPSDYMNPVEVVYQNKLRLENVLYDNVFEQLNSYKGTAYSRNEWTSPFGSPNLIKPFYTIKDNAYLLVFNLTNTGDMIHLRYEKLPTTLVASTDVSTITNDVYAKTTIPYLAVGEFLFNRDEGWKGAELLNFAMWNIRSMYAFYNKSSKEKDSGKQYRMWKGHLNI
jgi:hypothetical protein